MRLQGRVLKRTRDSGWRMFRAYAPIAAASFFLALIQFSGILKPIDNGLAAFRASLVQHDASGSIVVVEIDEASLHAAGEWPWPRERFATAIRNLHEAGSDLIAFDVDFSTRSSGESDAALESVLDAYPGAIVLPTFMRPGSGHETMPLAALARNAVAGSVNLELDRDGKVRRYWRGFRYPTHYRASMASILADAPYGATTPFLIDYGIRDRTIEGISFEEVYRGTFDRSRVRGKVVLIGATAIELGDRFATPLHPSLAGVYIHAMAYESLVLGRTLVAPSDFVVGIMAFVALLLLWPKAGALNLRDVLIRHGAVLAVALLAPLALQAWVPISASLGLVLASQAISMLVTVHRELDRRAAELVRAREAHLSFVAMHDPETELPNRRAMVQEVRDQLTKNGGSIVAVVVIGIERFPVLRAAVGYANANKAVGVTARRIGDCFGEAHVFHIATSVLGVVLTATREASLHAHYEEALRRLGTPLSRDSEIGTQARVGVSFGLTGNDAPEKLLEQATIALDQARLTNKRCVRFEEVESIDPRLQLALVSDVDAGIAGGQFRLVYQVKVAARQQKIMGAEALMRWRHPEHGEISPDKFIPVAEETSAIDQLTRWALKQVIADQLYLRANGIDLPIALNVSGRSLSDLAFSAHVAHEVRKSGARLCVEVTETAVIADPLVAVSSIAVLKEAGVRVAIDDYGAGLSSLSYLKEIAADELKLDKSLIRDTVASARDRLIVKSTIDLAHGLGMTVVAEGVEDEATCALLATAGCDCVQGYLFSQPAAIQEIAELCTRVGVGDLKADASLAIGRR